MTFCSGTESSVGLFIDLAEACKSHLGDIIVVR